MDVPELLRVLDFACGDMRILKGESLDANLTVYKTPAEEFELSRVDWTLADSGGVLLDSAGPQIVLCTKGRVHLSTVDGSRSVELERGESVWLAASDEAAVARPATLDADGAAQVFRAAAGVV